MSDGNGHTTRGAAGRTHAEAIDLRVLLPGDRPKIVALAARAQELSARLRDKMPSAGRAVLESMPTGRFRAAADGYRRYGDPMFATESVRTLEAAIAAHGPEAEAWHRRLVLLEYLGAIDRKRPAFNIPAHHWPHVEDGLRDLLDAVACEYGDVSTLDWRKDLAAAQLRWVPNHGSLTGPIRLSPWRFAGHATVREKLALLRGLRHRTFFPRVFVTGHEWRGFRAGRHDEHPEQRSARYAALIAVNPGFAGCFHPGWMHDPALKALTPRVLERTEYMLSEGAVRIRRPNHARTEAAALATSSTRRAAYAEGRYRPQEYSVVVPRGRLLAWARRRWGPAFGRSE